MSGHRQRPGRLRPWRPRALVATWLACIAPLATAAPAASARAPTTVYSAAGLFNSANAYARAGKPGLAVLNYERARLLAPGDEDIAANERHVLESVHLPGNPPNRLQRAFTAMAPGAAAWLGVVGVALLGAAALGGAYRRVQRSWRWTAAGLGAAAVALTAGQAAVLWPTLHAGVVIKAATPVLVSPVPMGNPLFVLPEADSVQLLGEHETYTLIRTRAGRTGWVSQADVVPVVPNP